MRVLVRLVPLTALVLIASCDRASAPTDPSAAVSLSEHNNNHGSELSTVRGAGQLNLSALGLTTASFVYDIRQKHGRVSGEFRQRFLVDGQVVDITGEATCVSFDPVNHRAWVGGVIKRNRSTDPDYLDPTLMSPGMDVWFRAVDYSKGPHPVTPDRSTTFGFRGSAGFLTSADYCAGQPWPDADARTRAVLRGGIRIGDDEDDHR